MKILFFIPTMGAGGAERALLQIVNNYITDGDEIYVKTLFRQGKYIDDLNENIHYSYIFERQFRGNIHLFKLFSPQFLYKKMIKEKFDIIVSYLEGPTTRIISGCDDETKIINWVHTSPDYERVLSASYRSKLELISCYKKYNKTVFVAETARKQFFKLFPELQVIKTDVLYNPINSIEITEKSKTFLEFKMDSNEFNILSMGRLVPVKGFERLINICLRLKQDRKYNVHLYIIGTGEEYGKIYNLIQKENAIDFITLLGYQENPFPYLAQADLYVCSSYREGYSTAVIESLILGIPVVTTNCSGMSEILGENSEYGVIVQNDEESLYEEVSDIIENKEKYTAYKLKAEYRGKQFNMDEAIRKLDYLIKN